MSIDDTPGKKVEHPDDSTSASPSRGLLDEIFAVWEQLTSKGRNTKSNKHSESKISHDTSDSAAATCESFDPAPKTATDSSVMTSHESKCDIDSDGKLKGFATADGREFYVTYKDGDLKAITMPG